MDLTGEIIDKAAATPFEPPVRALDAIHLASAVAAGDVDVLVAYDAELIRGAQYLGIDVISPGARVP
ncbi:MAG: hypothetical protein M3383_08195 [Actinomycetota bacterium]|nr:hypothetical protein [Actinomycetota bacterium]